MGDDAKAQASTINALFAEADKAHEHGRHKRALRIYMHLATRYEETAAMGSLARMYEYGEGTQRDMDASLLWDRKAADLGCVSARRNLAIYHRGRGDTLIARDIFQSLVDDENDASAALELARMYLLSPHETKRVVRYLEQALRGDRLSPYEREQAEALLGDIRPVKPAAKKPKSKLTA